MVAVLLEQLQLLEGQDMALVSREDLQAESIWCAQLGAPLAPQGRLEVPPRALDWRDASLNLDRDSRKKQIRRDPGQGPSG
jgi:hypothetical protein